MCSRQWMLVYSKGTFSITSLWKGSIRVQIRFWEYARLILAMTYDDEKCHYFLGLSWKSSSLCLAQDLLAFQTVDCLACFKTSTEATHFIVQQLLSLQSSSLLSNLNLLPCSFSLGVLLPLCKKMENKYFISQTFGNLLSCCISIFSFNGIIE